MLSLGTTETLAWASTYYLPAILAVPMARDIGVSANWVFAAFSVSMVISALAGPLVGRTVDRGYGRGVLCASNLAAAAGLVMLATAQGPVVIGLAWLVLGAAMSMGLYDAGFSVLTRLYGAAARGPITGITLMAGFASTVGWPLSALFEAELGWRGACLAWAALHLVLGLPLNRLVIPKPPPRPPAAAAAAGGSALADDPAPRHAMAVLAFVFACAWFSTGAMAAHLPRLLQEGGATATAAIAAGAMVGPAQVAARLIEIGLFRRWHPLVSAWVATLCHPLGAAVLLFFGAPAGAAFALLHGGGNGLLTIARGTLPLAIFGPHGYGLRQGILGVPARFAQAGAPLLFGLLLDGFGTAAVAFSAGLSLAAFAALFLLRGTARRRPA
ncbi:MAG: MFS transporter [Rhodospirillales bacterium]